ncbi:MAG TPA: sigma-54 dependent transcriptional regulator [Polyangiaceae bacterium]
MEHPRSRSRVLVVEDDDETRSALSDALEDLGHQVKSEPCAESALTALEHEDVDAVLTDVRMPGMGGIELCRRLSGDRPNVPVVVMTAYGDVDSAVGALRAGAFDFITKPFSVDGVAEVLDNALDRGRSAPPVQRLSSAEVADDSFHGLVGSSPAMRALHHQIGRAAATDSTVLVTGESGTGKELVARAIHRASDRSGGPFVAVSCAAVPHEILEAELFGHEKGAFTGAVQARIGLFEQASGGTLFLDEIGDMPIDLQPKLLRVLQERRVRPLGASREVLLDTRIVAATNRDLEQAVRSGQFREDLHFRIKVLHLHLPPLRERERDVLELAQHFLPRTGDQMPSLTPEAEQQLIGYDWPGNVRELENAMRAAVALASTGQIGLEELPTTVRTRRGPTVPATERPTTLEEVERRHIEIVLKAVGWNKARAARKLGIDRATLYRKLSRFGLDRPVRNGAR